MAEEDSHPTKALFTTLKESFFSSQQSRAEESLLYNGGGRERERESGGGSLEATNVWRKLEIEVLNTANAPSEEG